MILKISKLAKNGHAILETIQLLYRTIVHLTRNLKSYCVARNKRFER